MPITTRRAVASSHRPLSATSTLADAIGVALRSQRRSPAPRRRAPAALMLAALAFAGSAQAQSAWTNPGLADWFDTGNWSAGVPDINTSAEIDNGGVAEVAAPDAMADDLRIGNNASGGLYIHSGGTLFNRRSYVGDGAGSLGQVVVDGAGSAWGNSGGVLYVGNYGAAEMLVSNGGAVFTYNNFLGVNEGAQAVVTVDGAGSSWTVNGMFVAGAGDGSAQFTIRNGGTLSTGANYIGSQPGSQGTMVVDGAGSSWSSTYIAVGLGGQGWLTITNGGLVSTDDSYVAYADGPGTVLVDGAGSRWDSRDGVKISKNGQLTIQNGGTVSTDADGTSLVDGTAVVDGTGSRWTNGGSLIVGRRGSSGQLTISNGGVASSDLGVIGEGPGTSGTVLIDGAGSSWQNRELNVGFEGTGTLAIRNGGEATSDVGLIGAREGGHGEVVVDGAGSRWTNNVLYVGGAGTGLLTIGNGGLVSSTQGVLGAGPGSRGTVVVDGAGSQWSNSDRLTVGYDSQITIQDGGTLSSGQNNVVGTEPGSRGTVLVDGAGSLWNASSGLVFGYDSRLTIQNGGTVISDGGYMSTDSAALVDGEGSTWRSGSLSIGRDDGAATLGIRNGGDVFSEVSYIGYRGNTSGVALVDGAGSTWQNRELNIGFEGTGTLEIRNGGEATSIVGHIGAREGGHGEVVVDGAGSRWTNTELYAGAGGTGQLTVGNGGTVVAGSSAYIGMNAGSQGIVQVDGAGSSLTVGGEFMVGRDGAGTLIVQNGGNVTSEWTRVGLAGGSQGTVRVDGAGSSWSSGDFYLGYQGVADLTIGNGGLVSNTLVVMGSTPDSHVTARVDGAGSRWESSGDLAVGHNSLLTIHNGGTVVSGINSYISHNAAAVVDGTDSAWHSGEFFVGLEGAETGTLTIRNGAGVFSAGGYVGGRDNSSGAAVVDGVGSHWSNSRDFVVGDSGSGEVTISNGGTVTNARNGAIGNNRLSSGTVLVDGAGSRWSNGGELAIGNRSTGTLTIANGGSVGAVGTAYLSRDADAVGTLNIGAAAGDAAVGAGAFDAARLAFGAGAGTLVFNHTQNDYAFATTISGNGTIEVLAGTTVLTATNETTGTNNIRGGTLRVDGALGGDTRVSSGATLSGIGRLGNVDNAGIVAAGDSIGRLSLTGDYVHRNGATLLVEIEPRGTSDLLDIAGTATIEGGRVQVVKLPGQYRGWTDYILIDAAGGISGSFSALEQDLPFLEMALAYDANRVYLRTMRNDTAFASVCRSFNQCRVASAIDTFSASDVPPPADLIVALDELTTLNVDGALAAFDRLSGEAHGSLAGLLLEGHALYGQAVTRRIADRREAVGADRLHGGVWARAYGSSAELDGDGNAHGVDYDLHGVAFGVDAWGGENWLVGASVNTSRVKADFRPGDRGEADTKNVALYASVQGERAYLDAVTSFAWWDNELIRSIDVGSIARKASSEYGGHRVAHYFEAGWTFTPGGRHKLQPLLSMEYAKLDQENFREHGAQGLDLIGRSQDVERTTFAAGLRWSGDFAHGNWTLQPTAQARWLHSFGDEYTEQEIAFAGAPETSFRVRGLSAARDRGLFGIGLQARRGEDLDLFVDLDYQQGTGLNATSLAAGARWRW